MGLLLPYICLLTTLSSLCASLGCSTLSCIRLLLLELLLRHTLAEGNLRLALILGGTNPRAARELIWNLLLRGGGSAQSLREDQLIHMGQFYRERHVIG